MKTRSNQILFTILFSLLILAGNISAKGTELVNASSLEIISENSMELESWMLEQNYWVSAVEFTIEQEVEESLVLESWMLENETKIKKETLSLNELPTTEKEQKLELESWMINANYWNIN